MSRKIKVKVLLEFETSFISYEDEKLNARATKLIREWVKGGLKTVGGYIPLYIKRDEDGTYYEDCTQKCKVKIVE